MQSKKNRVKHCHYDKNLDKYRVQKMVNGRFTYFGVYNTLEEARSQAKFLEEHNWNIKYKKKKKPRDGGRGYTYDKKRDKYRVQKSINGSPVYFGVYNTLEEARSRVEFLREHGWNIKYAKKRSAKSRNCYYDKTKGKFTVKKSINGHMVHFGVYKTEDEARSHVELLKEHDWNIKYKKVHDNARNYYYNKSMDGYVVQKSINGEHVYFGCCKTEDEARSRVEFLREHDWNIKYQKYKNKKKTRAGAKYYTYNKRMDRYVVQKVINGRLERFGSFKSVEEAIRERDLLLEYDWDLDALCDNN